MVDKLNETIWKSSENNAWNIVRLSKWERMATAVQIAVIVILVVAAAVDSQELCVD